MVAFGGAGLPGDGSADLGLLAGAAADRFGQGLGHHVGNRCVDHVGDRRDLLVEHVAVGVLDPGDEDRVDVDPTGGKRAVGGGHVHHGDLLGAERQAVHRLETLDAGVGDQLGNLLGADDVHQLGVHGVD